MRRRLLAIGVPALAVALLLVAAAMTGNLRLAQLANELASAPRDVVAPGAVPGPVPLGGGPGSAPAQGADELRAILDGFHRMKLIADLSVRTADISPPQKRILHFLDRRAVPQEEFSKVVTAAAGKPLEPNVLRLKFADFVNRLNALQTYQQSLLRLLASQYQLSSVYVECLTEENAPKWLSTIDELKQASAKIEERRQELLAEEKALRDATPKGWEVKRSDEFDSVRIQFHERYGAHMRELIKLGAVGRGIMEGELAHGLPLEDEVALKAAERERSNGEFNVNGPANDPREEAMVKRILAGDAPVVVVVLDGKHDLGRWLKSPEHRGIEYIRIKLKSYDEAAKDLASHDWARFLPRQRPTEKKEDTKR